MNDNKELGNRLKAADENYSQYEQVTPRNVNVGDGSMNGDKVEEELKYDTVTGTEIPEPMKSEPQVVPDSQNHGEVLGGLIDDAVEEKNKQTIEERHLKEEELQQFLRHQNGLVRRKLHVGGSNYTAPKNKNKRRAEKKSRKKNR